MSSGCLKIQKKKIILFHFSVTLSILLFLEVYIDKPLKIGVIQAYLHGKSFCCTLQQGFSIFKIPKFRELDNGMYDNILVPI